MRKSGEWALRKGGGGAMSMSGTSSHIPAFNPVLVWCWITVVDGHPTLNQHLLIERPGHWHRGWVEGSHWREEDGLDHYSARTICRWDAGSAFLRLAHHKFTLQSASIACKLSVVVAQWAPYKYHHDKETQHGKTAPRALNLRFMIS